MLEMVEDDVTCDGDGHGSYGAQPKKLRISKVDRKVSKRDAKSKTGKGREIDVQTADIRTFWKMKLKGNEVPWDSNLSQSNKTVYCNACQLFSDRNPCNNC